MNQSNSNDIVRWSKVSQQDIEAFGDEGDSARQLLLTPRMFELIGNIEGKTVFDAGCGTGYLSRKLAQSGAKVTGLEPAQSFFDHCIQREKEDRLGIKYLKEDLSKYKPETKFDVVVSNMVFMDIYDWKSAMTNCTSSLESGGVFVFSILHPCFPGSDKDWQDLRYVKVSEYFDRKPQTNHFGRSYTRPIQDYINLLVDNGCEIKKVVEPRISEDVVKKDRNWARNYHVPQFIFFKSKKK